MTFKDSRYIIGIDLGTTNSAVAYIDTRGEKGDSREIKTFEIPQLTAEGTVNKLKTLPSYVYLPGEYELPRESFALPWEADISYIIGEFARIQGARVPSRLVSSAKSWLCHNRVDRKGPILPWGIETASRRISPVKASSCYLKHMKEAWNYAKYDGDERNLFENQRVVITIPASFDETARELTADAARMAEINNFTMLEEPQAAFYSWIVFHENAWSEVIQKNQLILVCDIGGGTTDFNLISLKEDTGKVSFQRVAVGDHLMLGGDNMDLAIAREVEVKILGHDRKLDFQQWLSLAHQCRLAKEELLGDNGKDSTAIAILGKGRGVIGRSLKGEIAREEIYRIILEGFFKKVAIGDEVKKDRPSGFQELGLPYVNDTAVMKHLTAFLKRHALNQELNQIVDSKSGLSIVRPDVLLFNGGVFKSPIIRQCTAQIIRDWFGDERWSLNVLENDRLDHAVSVGAAYYGLVLRGKGVRISGGSGRAYYIAVEAAISKKDREMKIPLTTACIVPRGFEEGQEIHVSKPQFEVMTNRPVSFPLYSSSYRIGDKAGDIISAEKDSFMEHPPIKTVLHFGKKGQSIRIPVSLGIRLNEFGTLDVWCESKRTPHRWKLAFQTRMDRDEHKTPIHQKGMDSHTLDEATIHKAMDLIDEGFNSSLRTPSDVTPENLMKRLNTALNLDKILWPLFTIRKMGDLLIKKKGKRETTPKHEARWLNLAGFLLRPGFGYSLDDWRMKELWKIFPEGLKHSRDAQCRIEWWILWRRVAAGLTDIQQDIVFKQIAQWLLPSKKKRLSRLPSAEHREIWMLAGSLELLSKTTKEDLGDELIRLIKKEKGRVLDNYYWALSRIGARVPFHGPVDRVVLKEVAERWIEEVMKIKWSSPRQTAYAITQLARRTGDRTRDIDESPRKRIMERLSSYNWAEHFMQQIEEVVPLEWEDEKSIFGESLPVGLYIGNETIKK